MNKQTVIHSDNETALKTNPLSSHKQTWRKLKCRRLSERSQSEKHPMTPTTRHSEKGQSVRDTEKTQQNLLYGSGNSNRGSV